MAAQTFLKALEASRNGKGAHSHLSGWLFRIAHNLVIHYYRDRGRRTYIDIDDLKGFASHEPSPQELAEWRDASEAVERSMDWLTTKQAQAFDLRLQGNTFAEIAEMAQMTEGAVKANLHRARGNLRIMLQSRTREPI